MSGSSKLPLMVLATLLVGLGLPLASLAPAPATDHGDAPANDGDALILTGAGGDIAYTAHLATATDVWDMVAECGVFDPTRDYNVLIDGHGTGLAPMTLDEYADLVGSARIIDSVALASGVELPSNVDHSKEPYFPIVDSQGGQGSCAAWACSYYANGYLQAVDNDFSEAHNGTNKSHLMSPAWVYNKINYGYDSGSNWYRNQALMASVGNADWATMPYSDRDLYGWGGEDAWRIAPRYRVEDAYDLIPTADTMAIKAALVEGWVLPMALDAYQYAHLSDDDIISSVEYNSATSNHANTIVGYDDSVTADGEAGAFLVVNSWGRTWSGNGYYWMTYDALAELYWPVLKMYDKVDYEPALVGTIQQSTAGSKDCTIYMGSESGLYSYRRPLWWAGTREYPAFMCLDITELAEDVSLAEYYLSFASGALTATVSNFSVEWYPDGYDIGHPHMTATSDDTPATAPLKVLAGFSGVHIAHTSPETGTWHRAEVAVKGTATESVPRLQFADDFEGRWASYWTNQDTDAAGGSDAWGVSTSRQHAGNKSLWAGGSDGGTALFEGFDHAGSSPAGWATSSLGPDQHPFAFVNTGYAGCKGSDYLAVANSDRGAGTNMTELLHTSIPVNATSFDGLELRFYLSYDHYDGDEHLKVLAANGSAYPNWTEVANWTADTFGYQAVNLSAYDGEASLYLAFEYHGTADRFVTLDDVHLTGVKAAHDANMSAELFRAVSGLDAYDEVTMEYRYWMDTERGVDTLSAVYRNSTSSPWIALATHSGSSGGWLKGTVLVPGNATHVGFLFTSDADTCREGVYLDDVVLTGHVAISSVEVSVDGGGWENATGGPDWTYLWDTTGLTDGRHDIVARANYSGHYDSVAFHLLTDNTAPDVLEVGNGSVTTGEPTTLRVRADDLNGVAAVRVLYEFNTMGELGDNASSSDNVTWNHTVPVPSNAVELHYRFWLVDTIGNEVLTDRVRVDVVDNDDPWLGEDKTAKGATTGDTLTFSIIGRDNVEVASVSVQWWYGEDGPRWNHTVTGATLRHTVDVAHTLEPIHYVFTVEDISGNAAQGEERVVPVTDNDLPVLGPDGTPSEATTGENVTLSIGLEDNIAIAEAWVEYRFGDGEPVRAPLDGSSTNWTLTVDVPGDSVAPLRYAFFANDSSGNLNSTPEAAVTILDNDLPELLEHLAPAEATTGDPMVLSVRARDNIGVSSVTLEYWYGEGRRMTTPMVAAGWESWELDVIVAHTDHPLHYLIHVQDGSMNSVSSGEHLVNVSDNDEPRVDEDGYPRTTTTGVGYLLTLDAEDNLGVASVTVTYWYNGRPSVTVAMEGGGLDDRGNGTYSLIIEIPSDSTDPLFFSFQVEDLSGNINASSQREVTVLDVTDPQADAGGDVMVDQHQEVAFSGAGSWDNVDVVGWTWRFRHAGADVVLEGTTASYVFHRAGRYTVTLSVEDPSGNMDTDTLEVTVRDTTPPVADAGDDLVMNQDTQVTFNGAGSTDNVGVVGWTWTFEYGGVPKTLEGQDHKFIFYTPGTYEVTLTVVDAARNTNATSINVKVRDIFPPEPVTRGDQEGRVGGVVRFNGNFSTDNVGVVNWTWTIRLASGRTEEVYGPIALYTFEEPGDHKVTLTVRDADGNEAVSEPFNVHVPNVRLWLTLLAIILGSVVATAIIGVYYRRKYGRLRS